MPSLQPRFRRVLQLRAPIDPLFDADWYRERYPDVGTTIGEAYRHYLAVGKREGRQPSPVINAGWFTIQHAIAHAPAHLFPCNLALNDDRPIALVFDDEIPRADTNAGAAGMVDYLRVFRDLGFTVVLVPISPRRSEPYASNLEAEGVHILLDSRAVPDLIARTGTRIRMIFLSRPLYTPEFINHLRRSTGARVVFCGRDLAHLRLEREATLTGDAGTAQQAVRFRHLEAAIARTADVSLVYSETEAGQLRALAPGTDVRVVPAYVAEPVPTLPSGATPNDLVFIGGFRHQPNADGVRWFLREVWPLVAATDPRIRFIVVGAEPPEDIRAAASDRVVVTGHVPDLRTVVPGAFESIAPLRYGAGVKGKIVTSMQYGLPVITTTMGAEGMHLDARHALIADDPTTLAAHILDTHRDAELRRRLRDGGTAYVAQHHSPEHVRARLAAVLPGAQAGPVHRMRERLRQARQVFRPRNVDGAERHEVRRRPLHVEEAHTDGA